MFDRKLSIDGLKQARKLQDAQAEKLTSWEAHKLANWQADKSTTDKLTSWQIDKLPYHIVRRPLKEAFLASKIVILD